MSEDTFSVTVHFYSFNVMERGFEKQALQRSSAVDGNEIDEEGDAGLTGQGYIDYFMSILLRTI